MKEMADSEEQMHILINTSAREQQNGKYSGMSKRLQLIDIIGPAQPKPVVVFLLVLCFCLF